MTDSRWPILIALGAVAAWIAVILVAPLQSDFMSFYAAGNLLLRHPHSLYWVPAMRTAEAAIGSNSFLPWVHLPPEAALFAPLTLLSLHTAFAVWSAVNICMFVLSGWLLREEILSLTIGVRCIVLAFFFSPIAGGLILGQDHGLFLLLWVLAYRRWKSNDDFGCGLWIGLSLLRYPFAIPMLLFFIVLRKGKLLAGAALSGSALVAASFLLVGPGLVPSYLRLLRFQALTSDIGMIHLEPTVRGFAAFLPSHSNALAAAGVVGLLAWALAAVRGMKRLHAFSFALLISLLADLHGPYYDLTVVAMPLLLSLKEYPKTVLVPLILCALTVAMGWTHLYLFVVYCPVLLVWAIWMSRAYRKMESGQVAPLEFSRPLSAGGR